MTPALIALGDVAVAGPDLVPPVWRATAALALVLALLVGLGWLLRRGLSNGRTRRTMSVDAALALGERRSLAIVTIEGRRLLLGLAPGHVSLVTELSPAQSFDAAVTQALTPKGAA
jgi:flagellar protein FliO/FliZ